MKRTLLALLFFGLTLQAHSQYCLSGGPSSNIDSNLEGLTLIGATGSITYTGCVNGGNGFLGVEEQVATTVYLDAGSNYTVNLQFGTCGGNFGGVGEAWIDYNLDGAFDASESIGTWAGAPPTAPSVFNFTVPLGATTGQSRMRVIQQEGGSLPIDPCGNFSWGSVTDFSIYIQNGVDCSSYIGDNLMTPRPVTSLPFTETHDNSFCYSNQNPVYNSPDVYYLLTGLTGLNSIEVSLCGSSFDTFLSILKTDSTVIAINDDHIDCGSQSKLNISTNGEDSLYIIVEGWGTSSGSYTIAINETFLAVEELKFNSFSVFPNPVQTNFQIGNEYSGPIEVRDIQGKLIFKKEIMTNEVINTTELKNGVYYLSLISDNQKIIEKLIIRK
ncbi:MAG TPA: T9SS type A sorting domain-containing protein [Crocinitomicaceae bacterium]|nr:T9SS type A sorting domain-containing protein [Crocinitomicaceae bacterium]